MENIKLVVAGPKGCGKTCLLISYATNAFPGEYLPSMFENYSTNVMHKGIPTNLELIDTACSMLESVGGRDLATGYWASAHVIGLCVDLSNPKSIDSLKSTVWPVASAAGVPMVLIGTKLDKREQGDAPGVTYETGLQLSKDLNAVGYVEASALTQKGLKAAFDVLLDAGFNRKNSAKDDGKKYNLKISVTTGTVSEAQDSNGLADPYLKIKQGVLSSWTSKVQKKTLSPAWNEDGIVKLGEPYGKSVSINIELWDQDALKDDYIGTHKVDITVGSKQGNTSRTFYDKAGKAVGTANIALEWVTA